MEIRIFLDNEEIKNQELFENSLMQNMDLLKDKFGDLVKNDEMMKYINNLNKDGN